MRKHSFYLESGGTEVQDEAEFQSGRSQIGSHDSENRTRDLAHGLEFNDDALVHNEIETVLSYEFIPIDDRDRELPGKGDILSPELERQRRLVHGFQQSRT